MWIIFLLTPVLRHVIVRHGTCDVPAMRIARLPE
jgi:hypothetical protein